MPHVMVTEYISHNVPNCAVPNGPTFLFKIFTSYLIFTIKDCFVPLIHTITINIFNNLKPINVLIYQCTFLWLVSIAVLCPQ